METSSSTGPTTRANNFNGWSDEDRRGFVLYLGWRDYWTKKQGYSGEFRRQDPEAIRADHQFKKFVQTAEWLKSHGRDPSQKLCGWRLYLDYCCDIYTAKRYRPTPAHLMSDMLLEQFNRGCAFKEEARISKPDEDRLLSRYRQALHPLLRGTEFLKILGFN